MKFDLRLWHFLAASAIAIVWIAAATPLALLSIEPNLGAFGLNLLMVTTWMASIGVLLFLASIVKPLRRKIRFHHVVQNTLALTFTVLLWFYGAISLLFQWPSNLERTTPEITAANDPSILLGCLLLLASVGVWGGWLVRLAMLAQKHSPSDAESLLRD